MTSGRRTASAARLVTALAIGIAAPAAARPALAQARDTLIYDVALVTQDPHLSVEARLTSASGGIVVLSSPPAAPPAGTGVTGFAATDDRGGRVGNIHTGNTWSITLPGPGALRFRYRLDMHRRVPDGSTASGMDSMRLYAVTRSIFVAPDPTAYRKTGRLYPFVLVHLIVPDGWRTVAGWPERGGNYLPRDGDDLLGATLAAAPDFRFYQGALGRGSWQLA